MPRVSRIALAPIAAVVLASAGPAFALPAYDTPSIAVVKSAQSFIRLDVTAGPSGANAGFTIDWMRKADFDANGGWPADYTTQGYEFCTFDGVPTLNTTQGVASYRLGPNETALVVLGELFDETGMYTNYLDEMGSADQFVVRIHAEGDLTHDASAFSQNLILDTTSPNNCTFTIGYWKTHGPPNCQTGNNGNVWPLSVMTSGMTLGTHLYTAAELCSILNTPAGGNGLISLCHQLIAAKLNIANGADPTAIAGTIVAADALIGGLVCPPVGGGSLPPSSTSAYTSALDDYNNGLTGPPHCGSVPTRAISWGSLKVRYH